MSNITKTFFKNRFRDFKVVARLSMYDIWNLWEILHRHRTGVHKMFENIFSR